MSLLIGYLADVDFGSEGLRFLGSMRFDLYGAFKLLTPTSFRAAVKTTPSIQEFESETIEPFLSIALMLFEYLTPTFGFVSAGLNYLTRKGNLIPFVLDRSKRTCTPVDQIAVDGISSVHLSIDGELYKADSLIGEMLQKPSLLTAKVPEENLTLEKSLGDDTVDLDSLLGKVLRIA